MRSILKVRQMFRLCVPNRTFKAYSLRILYFIFFSELILVAPVEFDVFEPKNLWHYL